MKMLHFAYLALSVSLIAAAPLPDTKPWDMPKDPAAEMVEGLHRYLDRQTVAAAANRPARWKRVTTSREAYEASIEPKRKRLAEVLGATGTRVAKPILTRVFDGEKAGPRGLSGNVTVSPVRWNVYPGFDAEGLLLQPFGESRGDVIVIADGDDGPEQLAGLGGLPTDFQLARLIAAHGLRVLMPTLLDRTSEFSGNPIVRMTNLPHREWIYRMAYETGRHVVGYEVDEVRSAIDWLKQNPSGGTRPLGVIGYGEGGLIALHTAALDSRVDATWVAGYFGRREGMWNETIDRNLAGYLEDFGNAEVASLILPRALLIESCRQRAANGQPAADGGRNDAASGDIKSKPNDPAGEFLRLAEIADSLKAIGAKRPEHIGGMDPLSEMQSDDAAVKRFLALMKVEAKEIKSERDNPLELSLGNGSSRERMSRLVRGMEAYTQSVIATSELRREAFWSKANRSSVAEWEKSTVPYREQFWTEILGKFPPADVPMAVESKQVYDTKNYVGYAIKIPVYEDVFAYGVLLLPKDLKPGERRPVVVCQHGLEGTPEPVCDPNIKSVYNSFGAQLADRGYIVYAPQNPYTGHDRFRHLQRKANPLGKSLFGLIIRQHERTLEWLKARPDVDAKRIAFYGLSYGGKSAMRLPAVLTDYCMSICSADFNEWVVKCTNINRKYSYLFTIEYDMYEFGLAEKFNYAEMAALIAPRPFMVERGHDDGVAPDEWIGYEFAKVKLTYDRLRIGDLAQLAIFNGGHQIDGKESFAFLAKHLNWPRGLTAP